MLEFLGACQRRVKSKIVKNELALKKKKIVCRLVWKRLKSISKIKLIISMWV